MTATILESMRLALRLPFVPQPLARLAEAEGFLAFVWPQVADSVETAGFLGSARYMADMALDAVEEAYEPELSRASLRAGGMSEADLDALVEVIDLFHYAQPQLLLLFAALAEAWGRDTVGGQGRPDPREPSGMITPSTGYTWACGA